MFFFTFSVASYLIPVNSLGYTDLSISPPDVLALPLKPSLAVFLDLPPSLFRGSFQSATTYDPIELPITEFTALNYSTTLTPTMPNSRVRFWLLSASICPDPTNIAIINTPRTMRVETRINGTLCLFPHVDANHYRAVIDTGLGFPMISFYSSRGRGIPVKTCRGESDYCEWESDEPFFIAFHGDTHVNLSYSVTDPFSSQKSCSILGVPTFADGRFEEARPKMQHTLEPKCIQKESGLVLAARFMGLLFGGIALTGMAIRCSARKGGQRWRSCSRALLCAELRQTYDVCA
jgi:hypothetical protein